MGSKGSTTTNYNQSAQQTPNPYTAAAGQQALIGAQGAAQQPFWLPPAPVAGFSPMQQAAFGNINAIQGQAQPWYNQAGQFAIGSQTPITGADVSQYYNPMAANVTAQMQNIFGQQNVQNTGQLQQAAGGVGADRIAVGQANLANQQGLAAGQTYANLYQQALAAAEAQKQQQANAAYAMGNLGKGAQAANLQGIQAQLGAGGLQQQLAQAQMQAPYNWLQQQFAYPFQSNQYLAGIAGGLGPAMGGMTTGQGTQTTIPPQPSPISQILGLGTAGLGILGQSGYNPFAATTAGAYGTPTSGFEGNIASAANPYNAFTGNYGFGKGARGGRMLPHYATGGTSSPNFLPSKYTPISQIPASTSAQTEPTAPSSPELVVPAPGAEDAYFQDTAGKAGEYLTQGPWSVGSNWHMPSMPAPGPVLGHGGFGQIGPYAPPSLESYGTGQTFSDEGTGHATSQEPQSSPYANRSMQIAQWLAGNTGKGSGMVASRGGRFQSGGSTNPFGGVDNLVPDIAVHADAQGEFPSIPGPQQTQGGGSQSQQSGGIGQVAQMAMQVLPMLAMMDEGGRVAPKRSFLEMLGTQVPPEPSPDEPPPAPPPPKAPSYIGDALRKTLRLMSVHQEGGRVPKRSFLNLLGTQTPAEPSPDEAPPPPPPPRAPSYVGDTLRKTLRLMSVPHAGLITKDDVARTITSPPGSPLLAQESAGGAVMFPGHYQDGGGDDTVIDSGGPWSAFLPSGARPATQQPQDNAFDLRGAPDSPFPPQSFGPPPRPVPISEAISKAYRFLTNPGQPKSPPIMPAEAFDTGALPQMPATAFEQDTGRAGYPFTAETTDPGRGNVAQDIGPKPVKTIPVAGGQAPSLIPGDTSAVAQAPATAAPPNVPVPAPRPDTQAPPTNPLLDRARAQTQKMEGGIDPNTGQPKWANVTTTRNRYGVPQHALGAYGIMDFNLPQWSRQALGRVVSPQEFLANPQLQTQIYDYKMGDYLRRFGVEGAGRAWLGGEGALNAPLARDPLGTSVGGYGRQFASAVGGAGLPGEQDIRNRTMLAADQGFAGQPDYGSAMPSYGGYQPTVPYNEPYPAAGQGFGSGKGRNLVNIGASIAGQATPWAGINIGRGITETEKIGREEVSSNQAAQRLWQEMQKHVDTMTRLTPQQQIEATRPFPLGIDPDTGAMRYGIRTPEGAIIDPTTGRAIFQPGGDLGAGVPGAGMVPVQEPGPRDAALDKFKQQDQEAPKASVPELESDLLPSKQPGTAMIAGPFAQAEAQPIRQFNDQIAKTIRPALTTQREQLDRLKSDYTTLMQDPQSGEGFFNSMRRFLMMPGSNNDPDFALGMMRKANNAATAIGQTAPFDPKKIAAMEEVSKIQKTMGMSFAGTISARDSQQMQLASIGAQPGLTQSPQGMARLIGMYDGLTSRGEDRIKFWNRWQQVNPRRYAGWDDDFEQKNPVTRTTVKSIIDNMPNQQAKQRLPEAVKLLQGNANNPDIARKFDQIYGPGMSSYFLTGQYNPMAGLQ